LLAELMCGIVVVGEEKQERATAVHVITLSAECVRE
jgi:hypothetical protein